MKKARVFSVLLSLVLTLSMLSEGSVLAFDSNATSIEKQLPTTSSSNKKIEDIVADPELLADFVKQATFKVSSKTLVFSKRSVLSTPETGSTITGRTDTLTFVPLSDLAFIEIYNEVVEMRKETSDMVVLTNGGSSYKYMSDNSLLIKIYSTVYYNTTAAGASSITKITGGITASGTGSSVASGVTITANYLNIGQIGATANGVGLIQNDYKSFSNSTRSWTYYPPTSWVPVFVLYTGVIGCSYFVTLKRSSSWTTTLTNNPFSS